METIQQYLIKTDDHFVVEQEKNIVTVFFGAQEMMVINLKDKKEVKDAVIYFKKINVSTHKVSKILKICRETVDSWFKIYQNFDRDALYNIKMGPKKVTPEIEAYIIAKTKDLEFCGKYRKIIKEGIQKHFDKEINVATISYTLKKNNIDTSIKKYNKILKSKKNTTISYKLENLGLFFIFPFLKKFDLKNLFLESGNKFKNKYYGAMDYIYLLIILLSVNLIDVEENIKNLQDKDLGKLIGKNNIPCVKNFRKKIDEIISNTDMKNFQITLCKNYFNENNNKNELYIDGHFFPYFGSSKILKGYNSLRRIGMKGRTGYFINNIDGRPFFYILSDEYKGFREYLYDLLENLKQIRPNGTTKKFIFIFDRGGYSKKFCDDMAFKTKFICWRTGKSNLPSKIKWKNMFIEHKGNIYGETIKITHKVFEKPIQNSDGKIIGRNIWVNKGGKISPAYTNDLDRSLEDLVKLLTRRWAVQENIFKSLKKHGIDKICTYKKELYPDNWLTEEDKIREVKNPNILILKDHITDIKNIIKKTKIKIAEQYLKTPNSKIIDKLKNNLKKLENDLTNLKEKKENVPQKISMTKFIEEKEIVRLSGKKKKFMDLIKMLSYNVKQDIVDFIKPIYKDQRDINNFVTYLLRKSGEIKISNDKIEVNFKKYKSKKKTNSLKYLCNYLNKQNVIHPLLNKKIVYNTI